MKLSKEELKNKVNEMVSDNEIAIQLLEDIEDSMEIADNSASEELQAKVDELQGKLNELQEKKLNNILALRGDLGKTGVGEFTDSQMLMRHIRDNGNFGIAGACYPEGHLESNKDVDKDVWVMEKKEEAGAEFFISQLFFDNNVFYDFLEKTEKQGIKGPIQAGIMPVVNKRQIERVVSLCGATLPKKFLRIMDKYEHDKLALRDAGIAFALEQIVDLASAGVRGIHLYTMNNPHIAKTITRNLDFILSSINREAK